MEREIDFSGRCYRCFRQKEPGERACADCGFTNEEYAPGPGCLVPTTPLRGKYIVGAAVGIGGFAVTYAAYDTNLKKRVAVKELFVRRMCSRAADGRTVTVAPESQELFAKIRSKFRREAEILVQLEDSVGNGIVRARDCFEENDTAYIVMDYIDGVTLKERANGGMPFKQAVSLLSPVVATLEKIHADGYLHLDVSPDNIIIMPDGGAKLLDFGGAKSIGGTGDEPNVSYKKGYAPPEQYRADGESAECTDVYGLAATVYYCLTGKKPADCMERLAGVEVPPPSKCGARLPKAADKAVMKGLALEKWERCRTVAEFWSELGADKVEAKAMKSENKKKKGIPAGIAALIVLLVTAAAAAAVYFYPFDGIKEALGWGKSAESSSDGKDGKGESGKDGKGGGSEADASGKGEDGGSSSGEGGSKDSDAEPVVGETIAMDPGTYIFENAADRDLIMGIDSGFGDTGARLCLKDYEDRNCNRVFVTPEEDGGFYTLRAAHTDSLIEAASQDTGAELGQYLESFGLGTDRWAFVYCGHDDKKDMDAVVIRNAAGTVIAPEGGKSKAGAALVLAEEDENDDSQVWYVRWSEKDGEPDTPVRSEGDLVEGIDGTYNFVSALDGKVSACISGDQDYHEEATMVVYSAQWLTAEDDAFAFRLEATGSESRYRIFPMYEEAKGKCLEYDPEDDCFVLRKEGDSKNQLFRVVYAGYNTYLLQAYDERLLCFEAEDGNAAEGEVIRAQAYDEVEDSRLVKWMLQTVG